MTRQITVGVLLAAGTGRRFDPTGAQNKLLQLLDNGTPVAVQSAKTLLLAVSKIIAVVHSPELARELSFPGCEPLIFAGASQGMGATLAYAAAHIVEHYPEAHALLVGLADMPYLKADTVQQVVEQLELGADIVVPVYRGRPGHPVGFAQRHFAALMALQGDTGARHLLREFPVLELALDDPGAVLDIDYVSDLRGS